MESWFVFLFSSFVLSPLNYFWKTALDSGAFEAEITPISLPSRKKGAAPEIFAQDEHPRPQATVESLAKLPTVFAKGGVVTAGNASGVRFSFSHQVWRVERKADIGVYFRCGRSAMELVRMLLLVRPL